MKFLLKFIAFILFLSLIAAATYAWVNIWVSKDNVGIYTKASQEHAVIVTHDTFYWNWERIKLYQSKLVLLPLSVQNMNTEVSFYLPKSTLYANALNIPTDTFRYSAKVNILYILDTQEILDYVNDNFKSLPMTKDSILELISQELSQEIFLVTQKFSDATSNSASSNSTQHEKNIETQLIQDIRAIHSIPVKISEVFVQTLHIPDFELYTLVDQKNFINTQLNDNTVTETSSNGLKNLNAMNSYLHFISELGRLTKDNNNILEIMKIVPPNMSMFESESQ